MSIGSKLHFYPPELWTGDNSPPSFIGWNAGPEVPAQHRWAVSHVFHPTLYRMALLVSVLTSCPLSRLLPLVSQVCLVEEKGDDTRGVRWGGRPRSPHWGRSTQQRDGRSGQRGHILTLGERKNERREMGEWWEAVLNPLVFTPLSTSRGQASYSSTFLFGKQLSLLKSTPMFS